MKKNEKRMILILLIILIFAIAIFVTTRNKKVAEESNTEIEEFVKVLEDGTKLNTSSKLTESKTVGVYKIGNIQLTMKDNQSVLLADVENTSASETDVVLLDIILYDKQGNEIATIPGIISPMKAGEKTQLNTSVTADYVNVYDFKINIKK